MNTVLIGVLSIVVLLILIFLHMPISIVMVVVGTIGYALVVSPQAALIKLGTDTFNNAASYTLSVIPMFLLMGLFLGTSGLARRLFEAFNAWLGHIRGGLAIASIAACAFFAAVSGSNIGTAATIGKVAVPEMRIHKYKDSLSAGCVAAGGTLGILIPPSSLMIVYGALTEESIGKLLISGILPGIVTAVLLAFAAWLQVRLNPGLAPIGKSSPFTIKMQTLKAIWPVPVIFAISMGGIWLGVFTATEGGAIGAFLSLVYAFITRQLSKKGLNSALEETANVTAMIFLVIIGGTLYGHFLTATRIPLFMKEYIVALNLSPFMLLMLVFVIYFVAGFVMDAMAIIVIFTNLFYPLVTQAGYNGIWFGVITIMLCNIGFLTPPVGPVSMVTASSTDTPVEEVFKGVTPFWFALITATFILIAFPIISTYLPSMMAQ